MLGIKETELFKLVSNLNYFWVARPFLDSLLFETWSMVKCSYMNVTQLLCIVHHSAFKIGSYMDRKVMK